MYEQRFCLPKPEGWKPQIPALLQPPKRPADPPSKENSK